MARWLQYDTLVFSGGGAKGFAEIGAVQALERHFGLLGPLSWRERIHTFIGTSFGAIVAAMCAMGLSGAAMEQWLSGITMRTFFMPDWFRLMSHGDGCDDGTRGKAFLRRLLEEAAGLPGDVTLQQLYDATGRDLVTVTTNLEHNRMEALSRYTEPHIAVVDAVFASACLPVLYRPQPLALSSRAGPAPVLCIDGGLHANTPIHLTAPGRALGFVMLGDGLWEEAVECTAALLQPREGGGNGSGSGHGPGDGSLDGSGTVLTTSHRSRTYLASVVSRAADEGMPRSASPPAAPEACTTPCPANRPPAPVPRPDSPPPDAGAPQRCGSSTHTASATEQAQPAVGSGVMHMLLGAANHLLQTTIEEQLLQLDARYYHHLVLLDATNMDALALFRSEAVSNAASRGGGGAGAGAGIGGIMRPLLRRGYDCTCAFFTGQPPALAAPWLEARRLATQRFPLAAVLFHVFRVVLRFALHRTARILLMLVQARAQSNVRILL